MHGTLHALATLTLAPYFVLAAFFVLVGRAAAAGSWWDLFDLIALTALWTLRIGLPVVVIGFIALAGAGFFTGAQRIATLILTVLSGLVLLILLLWPKSLPDAGQLLFLLPCILVFAGSLYQALRG